MSYLSGWQRWPCLLAATLHVGIPPAWAQERVEEGERIAAGAGPGGPAAACVACHGAHGLGELGAAVPRLAGLDSSYLAKQLADYASGARSSAVMKPIADALSTAQRAAVARYYAEKPARPGTSVRHVEPERDARLLQEGATLWARGSSARQVQACTTCHSNRREAASAPVYPAVAGQPAGYVAGELRAFRDGRRRNDVAGAMRAVAARLGDRDIDALAAYIASLPP